MAYLDDGLHMTPEGLHHKLELLSQLWGCDSNLERIYDESSVQLYFAYYKSQCINALHDAGRHILARKHRDLVGIAKNIVLGMSREDIKKQLKSGQPVSVLGNTEELIDNSVDLAASLICMMDIGVGPRFGFSCRTPLLWERGPLNSCLTKYLDENIEPAINIILDKYFNARNLTKIAGITIEWTDNLVDHLRLIEPKRVAIFHHASFLKYHQEHNLLFPLMFAEETLRTLAILFPQSDKDVTRWVKSIASPQYIDSQILKCGSLRPSDRKIDKFKFWHDRLVILKEEFDDSRQNTLSQLWNDRCNGQQWYTFWIAVWILFLTIFFGIVQSIEGGLQVYKAYHPT